MAPRKEELLGRIAVERKLLTEDQLRDCKRAQLSLPSDPNQTIGRGQLKPLSAVMLEKALITPEQLTALLEEQERRLLSLSKYEEMVKAEAPLGHLLVKQNKATQNQINKCLEIQRRAASEGAAVPSLRQLLVQHGYVEPAALDEAMRGLAAVTLHCTNCGQSFNVVGVEHGRTYRCKSCGGIMMTKDLLNTLAPGETSFGFEVTAEDPPPAPDA